ncbi:MAG TPA: type II toxin-antitoxin system HicB family antitoxin [Ktedonobacterales bacterium]
MKNGFAACMSCTATTSATFISWMPTIPAAQERRCARRTYIVSIPEFPGNHTHGDTYEEAVKQGEDLIDFLIMWTLQDGKPLPEPRVYAMS